MSRPVAIVTGGARGIGGAICTRFGELGYDIVIIDLSPSAEGNGAVGGSGGLVEFIELNLAEVNSHAKTVARVAERFGRIDCLVNNAGIGSPVRGDFLEMTPETFDAVMAVNLRGTVFFTQAVLRQMLALPADGPRSVITISSASAEIVSADRLDYCMSKAALSMLNKGLAVRLAEAGISAFEVRPGIIRSEMTAKVSDKYDRLIGDGLVPMRRWGEGADVARIVGALASGDFNFATGSVIDADGGLSIQRL